MEATHSTLSRTLRLALAGCFLALAWLTLSLVATSVSAHADDGERDRPGLLGAVVDVVDTAADSAVVATVGEVAQPVIQPVAEVVTGGAVESITAPVVDLVTEFRSWAPW